MSTTALDTHTNNFADWLVTATNNLVAQAQAAGLEGEELVNAVRAALLNAVR